MWRVVKTKMRRGARNLSSSFNSRESKMPFYIIIGEAKEEQVADVFLVRLSSCSERPRSQT